MKEKAQVSLEYMIMLGISLVVLVAVLLVVNNMINTSTIQVSVSSASTAVEGIREAADFIYVTGHPSKIQKSIFIPNNVVKTTITGKTILFRLAIGSTKGSSYTDIYAITKGNLTGSICSDECHEGNYILVFESVDPRKGLDVNITRKV